MTKSTVIQSLRTYTSLINSPAKNNNKPFQNFMFLYHFRNSLHVTSVLSQSIRCTHLQYLPAFPCVVRPSGNLHEIRMYVVIVRGIERCITHFQTLLPHSALITRQASTCERCGGCIHQESRRNLAQRSIPASLRPWSFGVQPRSIPGHFNSCISTASLPWHFAI